MFTDLRLAFRSLVKSSGFTAIAVLTLALGIGATTTVFSWVERVLLNPLPGVPDASRIVAIETRSPSGELIDTSFPDFLDYRAQAKSFSDLLVFKERPLNLGDAADTERVWGQLVSGNFFDALRIRPRLGRFFAAEDRGDEPAAAPVAVISESLWRRRFQNDPAILGRTIKLNRQDYTVIGVAPAAFFGSLNGLAFDVWVPIGTHARLLGPSRWLETRGWHSLHTLGRLAAGATLASAHAELATIAARLATADPKTNRGISLAVMSLAQSPHGAQSHLGKPLLILLGVSGLLFLIVCANLSNLLLVRASARQREMCIRQALGAGWRRIVTQLLAESLLLSAAGTVLGLLLTLWMSDLLRTFIPDVTLPLALNAQLGPRVLLAAIALAGVTTLLAGLAPLLWVARPNLIDVLRASGRAAASTPRAEFFRRSLVIAQVAIAFVTLACAALAAKSFYVAKRAHPGFDAHGVLLAALKLDTSGYTREQSLAFLDRLQSRLPTLPGVEAAALAENTPLGLSRGSWEEIAAPGYVPTPAEDVRVYRNLVSPGYFSLMRIPLVHGREFTDADRAGAPLVAIVGETFARRYLGSVDAIGRTFSVWAGRRTFTVVGVTRDIKVNSLAETALPYYYVPLRQSFNTDTGLGIHLRTAVADPLTLLPALRAVVRELDPNVPLFEATTLEDFIAAARFAQKIAATLLGVLSVAALALTSLGLYGVLAFAVAQRTPEIGVRLALGAQPADILRLVLGRGAMLVAFGLGSGLLAALGAVRGVAALLYGVNPFEPGLLALAVVPIVLAAFAACWLPARRAAKVDPMVALRCE
jgi:macrolide transport system ATP-binding/permease protein